MGKAISLVFLFQVNYMAWMYSSPWACLCPEFSNATHCSSSRTRTGHLPASLSSQTIIFAITLSLAIFGWPDVAANSTVTPSVGTPSLDNMPAGCCRLQEVHLHLPGAACTWWTPCAVSSRVVAVLFSMITPCEMVPYWAMEQNINSLKEVS